jgi:hypothetical protein
LSLLHQVNDAQAMENQGQNRDKAKIWEAVSDSITRDMATVDGTLAASKSGRF